MPQLLFGAVVMAISWGVIVSIRNRHRSSAISTLSLLIALLCVYVLTQRDLAEVWLPCVALSGLLLWGVACASPLYGDLKDGDYKVLGFVVLLFLLPLAFSFGTGNRVLAHTQQAAVFAVVGLLVLLDRLHQRGLIHECMVAAAVAAFSAPTLFYQVNAALNVNGTYRQWAALGEQNIPVLVGFPPSKMLVDDTVHETLNSLMSMAQSAGYRQETLYWILPVTARAWSLHWADGLSEWRGIWEVTLAANMPCGAVWHTCQPINCGTRGS